MRPAVLVLGLDPRRVPGPWEPGPVVEAIEAGMRALVEAGYYAESCLVGLDGEDVAATVTAALTSRTWDCVLVGGGIRKAEDLLELFEEVVNLVRRHAPGAEVAFNERPDDLADSVDRRLRARG